MVERKLLESCVRWVELRSCDGLMGSGRTQSAAVALQAMHSTVDSLSCGRLLERMGCNVPASCGRDDGPRLTPPRGCLCTTELQLKLQLAANHHSGARGSEG